MIGMRKIDLIKPQILEYIPLYDGNTLLRCKCTLCVSNFRKLCMLKRDTDGALKGSQKYRIIAALTLKSPDLLNWP